MERRYTIAASLMMLLILSLLSASSEMDSVQQFEHASARSCGGPAATASIVILPPGPVTLPADQSRMFNATLYDQNDIELGGTVTWGTDDGSIQPQGGGGAIYYPSSLGTHFVWACAADINTSAEVHVTIGATVAIELSGSVDNVTSDDEIELQVIEFDIRGNSAPIFVPSQYWTIPEGSSIDVESGQPARWIPGPIGNHIIGVSANGFTAQYEVNVSRGVGQELTIIHSASLITSDDDLELSMAIADIAGNTWEVDGNWSTLQPEAAEWLDANGSEATFEGHTIGNWTVRAFYNGPENGFINMSDELVVDVRVGRTSLVSIDGHDTTILTGEALQLNPVATDLDGNVVHGATFNWSVDGTSGDGSIDAINATFTPSSKGQHTIYVDSGGRPASARIQVQWSEPIDLNVTTSSGDWYLTVTTGQSLPLHVEGLDVMGEWHPYDPLWEVDEAWGEIEETGGDGDYIYHSSGINWTQLHSFVGDTEYTILVYVTPGMLDYLTVTIQGDGVQGETATFEVEGFDISGNGVAIPVCDVDIVSSAGRAECVDEQWTLYLENDGEQQMVTASFEGSEGSEFIDIRPTLLEGKFGDSTQVIAAGAALIAVLITLVLLVAYGRVRRLAREFDDDDEEEITPTTASLPPLLIPSPPNPALQGMPPPPAPLVGQVAKGMRPPTPPPPFMFGQGIANSSGALPQQGVFVRSESQYGWGDPAKSPSEGYGWEGGPSPQTSAAIGMPPQSAEVPPPPPGLEPDLPSPSLAAPEPEPEPAKSSLSAALSKFMGSPIEEPAEENPEVEGESEEVAEEESVEEEVVWDEPEPEAIEEEWGDWEAEWEDPAAVSPGLGPQADDGDLLKPLPGTKAGESGWYFDPDGKPSLWEFRPFGWERIE